MKQDVRSAKLELTYVIASPKVSPPLANSGDLSEMKDFWHRHWSKVFAATGAPEKGWEEHFDQQDIVVALQHKSTIISCHLYTLYDLNDQTVCESDYFSYLQESSIETLKARKTLKLMSMEYLGVSPDYQHNAERLSVGKLMVALATYVGESIGADAVFGTPISTTSTPKMMENVGAITLEERIEKYGYNLCLQYVPVDPRSDCRETSIANRARELWKNRQTLSRHKQFETQKRAA